VAAWLVELIGRRYLTIGFLLSGAFFSYLYGTASTQTTLVVFGLAMQFCFFGMWSVVNAYTPELFPTRVRATGAGIASSIERFGALIGPSIVGQILLTAGQSGVFLLGAAAFVIAAFFVLILGIETQGRPVEDMD